MGLFLALSGVIDTVSNDVQMALVSFAQERSGGLELVEGTTDTPNIGVISRQGPNTTVLYPDGFCEWDDASRHLSKTLGKAVFSLHIHDGDLWMFLLFRAGEEIGHFNPISEYWAQLAPEEKDKWKGDAALIAQVVPSVSPKDITRYFTEWDLEQVEQVKAYPTDQFTVGDCWQMCDFMKKLNLEYPVGDDGRPLGDAFRMWTKQFRLRRPTPQPPHAVPPRKPWWKFW